MQGPKPHGVFSASPRQARAGPILIHRREIVSLSRRARAQASRASGQREIHGLGHDSESKAFELAKFYKANCEVKMDMIKR